MAVAMGTSQRQLSQSYDCRGALAGSQLAGQLEQFEADRRFGGELQTVVAPFEPAHGGLSYTPARSG